MSLLVLAAAAQDTLYKEGHLLHTASGGPQYFIEKELNKLLQAYILAKSTPARVNIYMENEKETGEIVENETIYFPDNISDYSNIILSTVSPVTLDSGKFKNFTGTLFIDIQGFLRTLNQIIHPFLRHLLTYHAQNI